MCASASCLEHAGHPELETGVRICDQLHCGGWLCMVGDCAVIDDPTTELDADGNPICVSCENCGMLACWRCATTNKAGPYIGIFSFPASFFTDY